MKEFDINTIGKGMPYKAPGEDFFENFTDELLSKVEQEPKVGRQPILMRLAPLCGIAAAVAVVLSVAFNLSLDKNNFSDSYLAGDSLDDYFDSYFASLSDEELASMVAESSYQDDFYLNLLNE